MTQQAQVIMTLTNQGFDVEQILSQGVGKSESEVAFIVEQLKVKGYLNG